LFSDVYPSATHLFVTSIHQHLFMMNEKAKAIAAGDGSFKIAVSKIPMGDWTALLESG
jgi:hypothetical protein